MAKRFKHSRNRRTKVLTTVWIVFIAAVTAAVLLFVTGGYLQAWALSMLLCIVALYILSIPQKITVDENYLGIHCVVELTRIDVRDIRSIRKVPAQEYRWLFPVVASYGFFGYYGYYLNFKGWDMVKMYAGEWDNFVEIVDIYEQTYIVSCSQADELIESVMQVKLMRAGKTAEKSM